MNSLDSIRKKCKGIVKNTRDPKLEEELAAAGKSICEKAFASKETKNQTSNQHDAYVWALYFRGELIDSGFAGEKMATRPARVSSKRGVIWGRTEAENLIEDQKGKYTDGYALVVSNAIYYSAIHENHLQRHIITQELSILEELATKYNGKVTIGSL